MGFIQENVTAMRKFNALENFKARMPSVFKYQKNNFKA
jgi:hypothetical protein